MSGLTPERWKQVKELLEAALAHEPGRRKAFLAEACAGDSSLRREVETLISSHEQAASFLEAPAIEIPIESAAEDEADSMIGQQIGSYQLLRQIGHGGMGTVYLAARADEQYQRRVAIKLVKRGMDTDAILRRFRNERQILAALDHPNIAKLFDGGTTEDGLPYFVMEYIEGRPIHEYCDAQKLPTTERLKLFRMICSAVHYAHQNLVVHRDLKPSNILVTAERVPKLLDFGIAKLLNPELSSETVEATATALRLMTPEYASPEQARGEPITTGSDVYSLGVLLYELLTGHRPYRLKTRQPHEILRVICEQLPEKPSTAVTRIEQVPEAEGKGVRTVTPDDVSRARGEQPEKLRRRLAGDLDNIVLKALRKEPQRRYASVEQFSEDIQRHLDGRPVTARKDTLGYRAGKFIKRNKAAVAGAALLLLTLLGGIVATTWQAHVAGLQRARAERRFNDVRKLANSILFELHDSIRKLPGSTPTRELLVKRALEYLDGLAQEAGDDISLQRELAAAYQKVGDVQGAPASANVGDTAGALKSYREVVKIRERLVSQDPGNIEFQRELADSHDRTASVLGDEAGVLKGYRKALAIREALAVANPSDPKVQLELSASYQRIASVFDGRKDWKGSLENRRKAVKILEALWRANPKMPFVQRDLALSYKYTCSVLEMLGEAGSARDFCRKAIALDEERLAADPMSAPTRLDLSFSYGAMGSYLQAARDFAPALQNYRKALELRESVSAADPKDVWARGAVERAYNRIIQILEAMGDTAGALENARKALAFREGFPKPAPEDASGWSDLAASYSRVGSLAAKAASDRKTSTGKRIERWREARASYEKILQIWRDLQARGLLAAADAAKPVEIARELAKCDAALAELSRR